MIDLILLSSGNVLTIYYQYTLLLAIIISKFIYDIIDNIRSIIHLNFIILINHNNFVYNYDNSTISFHPTYWNISLSWNYVLTTQKSSSFCWRFCWSDKLGYAFPKDNLFRRSKIETHFQWKFYICLKGIKPFFRVALEIFCDN